MPRASMWRDFKSTSFGRLNALIWVYVVRWTGKSLCLLCSHLEPLGSVPSFFLLLRNLQIWVSSGLFSSFNESNLPTFIIISKRGTPRPSFVK